MRKLLDLLGRGIAYVGVCIILGERPAAWRIDAWTRATLERLKREHEEREKVLDKMVRDAMQGMARSRTNLEDADMPGAYQKNAIERDYAELPALTGHKPPMDVN